MLVGIRFGLYWILSSFFYRSDLVWYGRPDRLYRGARIEESSVQEKHSIGSTSSDPSHLTPPPHMVTSKVEFQFFLGGGGYPTLYGILLCIYIHTYGIVWYGMVQYMGAWFGWEASALM